MNTNIACNIEDNFIGPILSVLDTYLFDVEALEVPTPNTSERLFEKQMSEEHMFS